MILTIKTALEDISYAFTLPDYPENTRLQSSEIWGTPPTVASVSCLSDADYQLDS